MKIRFTKNNYKYRLEKEFTLQTPIKGYKVSHRFFELTKEGVLTVRKYYAWDGTTGPSWDTISNLFPSLIHDVFCQMIELGLILKEERKQADVFFYELLKKGLLYKGKKVKMGRLRSWIHFKGVRFGAKYWKSKGKRKFEMEIFEV